MLDHYDIHPVDAFREDFKKVIDRDFLFWTAWAQCVGVDSADMKFNFEMGWFIFKRSAIVIFGLNKFEINSVAFISGEKSLPFFYEGQP